MGRRARSLAGSLAAMLPLMMMMGRTAWARKDGMAPIFENGQQVGGGAQTFPVPPQAGGTPSSQLPPMPGQSISDFNPDVSTYPAPPGMAGPGMASPIQTSPLGPGALPPGMQPNTPEWYQWMLENGFGEQR